MLVPKSLIYSQLRNSTKSSVLASTVIWTSASCASRLFISNHLFFLIGPAFRNFGIIQEYNERKNKKLINNLLCTDEQKFWVTSSRPSNFGDPIDCKTKVDNWFDENR